MTELTTPPNAPRAAARRAADWARRFPLRESWRLGALMAWNDIRNRYKRTRLGALWLVVSHSLWILALFLVFGSLFQRDYREFLPYLAVGMTLWNFIASSVVGSAGVFVSAERYMTSFPFPKTTYPIRFATSSLIAFAHHLVVVVAVLILTRYAVSPLAVITFIAVVGIYYINAVFLGVILGFIGLRFRDTQYAVQSIMTMMFLLTPVFWRKPFLEENAWIADVNPFFHFLEIGRGTLLGSPVSLWSWLVVAALTVVFGAVAALMYRMFSNRVIYWL